MSIRRFVLVPERALLAAAEAVRASMEEWARGWGAQASVIGVECVAASGAAGALGDALVWRNCAGAGALSFAWNISWVEGLHRALFGCESSSDAALSVATAQAMFDQLPLQLAGVFGQPVGTAGDAFAPGSGALLVTLKLGRAALYCQVPAAAVEARFPSSAQAKLPPLPALALRDLFGALPVALPVQAGGAELTLGALASLAPGDVIRLALPVDRPLSVHTPGGTHLCNAYLGLQGGQVGIEVISIKK